MYMVIYKCTYVGSRTCYRLQYTNTHTHTRSRCPINSDSMMGSVVVTNCTCNAGYDVGDGHTISITSPSEQCSTSLEVRVQTASGEHSTCWTASTTDYCDSDSGTYGDIWLRLQWNDSVWTEWYALPSMGMPKQIGRAHV